MRQKGIKLLIKKTFDKILALTALICLSPIAILVAVLIKKKIGSPVLFYQERPGFQTKSFYVIKFRTMTEAKDSTGNLLPDEERLTPFGKWLRSTSLDEIPQLLNILKGDLSIVGPRPLLMEYLDRYTKEQISRHDVMPGLTGWAQINGRNALTWEKKFELDLWYVNNWTLLLDVKIILKTFLKVIKREGISLEGQATTTKFLGNKEK
jgi:undecaprenyl phosphate N,N'-diacetylbacillosamine 1-phosphate transferase